MNGCLKASVLKNPVEKKVTGDKATSLICGEGNYKTTVTKSREWTRRVGEKNKSEVLMTGDPSMHRVERPRSFIIPSRYSILS